MGLHVLRHLTSVKNVKLKALCMPGAAAQVCLNITVYHLYKRILHFHNTGVLKRSPGYRPEIISVFRSNKKKFSISFCKYKV